MSDLRQWQLAVAGAIDDDRVGDIPAAMQVPGLSAGHGCRVYRNSSRGARLATLEEIYPVCLRVLGDRSFSGLGREFVRREPSTAPDLNLFGAGFPSFVGEVIGRESAFAAVIWLADLAALEWACHRLYYAPDDGPIDLNALERADPIQLIPRTAALDCLRSRWPVHEIWSSHQGTQAPTALDITTGDYCLVVERRGFRSQLVMVDPDLWRLLDACRQGTDLASLAADASLDLGRMGELIERRWLVAVRETMHEPV